jgi:hypothetical protein
MKRLSWITHLFVAALILALSNSARQRLVSEAAPLAGSTAPSLWVTPLVLDFGPVGIGETSDTLTVSITNNGNATLTNFAGGGVNPPFAASQNCAVGVLPGGSCQYFFTFTPTDTGLSTATSSSSTNAGPFSIELRGQGVGAGLHVNPLSLDFGSVQTGNTSDTQVVTIRNTGLSTLANFAGGGVSAPFGASQNCAGGVPPGGSCQYFFDFSPTATGTFTATSNSSTNAGSFTIDLMGRGRSAIFGSGQRVTPRSLDFGPVGVGLSGTTLTVTITNQSPLWTITGWSGGGVYAPFGASQDCAGGVPPGASCQFYYTFSPTETGVFSTTSDVTNSFGSFTIELRGEGAGAGLSVSPLWLDFGSVSPGGSGTVQVVTIKNTSLATLTNFAGGSVNAPFSASQNCAGGVPPGAECQFNYNFNPTEWGRFSNSSNVSTNAGSFSIQLIGGIEPPSIALSFLPSQIAPGGTATIQYILHNPNATATLFDVEFDNTFPAGMSVASPLLYSTSPECGMPTFAPTIGATSITFASATLLGGDDCLINLNVTATNIGVYDNTTSQVSSASGSGNTANANLTVGWFVYLPLTLR